MIPVNQKLKGTIVNLWKEDKGNLCEIITSIPIQGSNKILANVIGYGKERDKVSLPFDKIKNLNRQNIEFIIHRPIDNHYIISIVN